MSHSDRHQETMAEVAQLIRSNRPEQAAELLRGLLRAEPGNRKAAEILAMIDRALASPPGAEVMRPLSAPGHGVAPTGVRLPPGAAHVTARDDPAWRGCLGVVREIVMEFAVTFPESIDDDRPLSEYGIDEIDLMQIATELERRLDIELDWSAMNLCAFEGEETTTTVRSIAWHVSRATPKHPGGR